MKHDFMKLFVHLKIFVRKADGGGRGLGGPPLYPPLGIAIAV